ncbi:TonB-dependent receptor domain-containing protein [Woodsholea maritima]|uniref:TonB-dependent receptor domain-containing protein n=1 Tax=Woodsholea maritima TaxID=240237 RepID=UPI0003645011|nr:TonB-dependent receptor [Woodsholea maritima]
MSRKKLRDTLVGSTLLSSAAVVLFAGASFAQANASAQEGNDPAVVQLQDQSEQSQESNVQEGDKIVVTGSRIRRNEFSAMSPIQTIDGEFGRDLGLIDASALLNQTTVVQGQQITTGVSTSAGLLSDNGPGSATAGLRGLDAGRTLVLVNGRRLAPAGVRGAPSAPDLNMIPGSLIQRVDVLLDGASSVYGSDAVAGVVNYVLRTDFDGFTIDFNQTFPQMDGNNGQYIASATYGKDFDNGFMAFALEYNKTDGHTRGEFGSFYEPYSGICQSSYTQGTSGKIYETCAGSFGAGSASVNGVGYVGLVPGTAASGLLPADWVSIDVTPDLLLPTSENGRLLLLHPEELQSSFTPDLERLSLYSVGEFELAPNMTAYYEASHTRRRSETTRFGQGNIKFTADYAYNPFENAAGPAAGTLYFLNRAENFTEVSQTRLIGGLKGDLPFVDRLLPSFNNFNYDVYGSFSRSEGFDRVNGYYLKSRFNQVMSNTHDDGSGNIVCDSIGTSVVSTCRPLNFFDQTFITTGRFADQADNEYFLPNRITNTYVDQAIFNGFISGDLFNLPDGPVSGVLGFEYRDESIRTETDAATASGDFEGFFGDPGSNGSRSLMEAFAEVEATLLHDRPFADELSLNLATRWTEEENFGAHWTYRIQATYAPTDWLRFRTTYGTSFRAPNLGEQFGGRVTGFADPSDPCRVPGIAVPFVDHDNDPSTPEVRLYNPALDTRDPTLLANCRNGGGAFNLPGNDPTSLGVEGLGTSSPVFLGATTQVASGSNPELGAETSDAFTGGIVFQQPWFDSFGFQFSSTYFHIAVKDEVDALTAATIVGRCYNSPSLNDPQCAFIQRDPSTGEVSFVEALNQNLGEQISEGIDYNFELDFDFNTPWTEREIGYRGIFRSTYMLSQTEEEYLAEGTQINDDLGEFGNPRWRLSYTNVLSYKDMSFIFQSRFVDNFIEANDDPIDEVTSGLNPCVQAGEAECWSYDDAGDYWVHDMSARYDMGDWIMRGGISNVFDEAPDLTNNNGSPIRGVGYDLRGRTFFLNVTKHF